MITLSFSVWWLLIPYLAVGFGLAYVLFMLNELGPLTPWSPLTAFIVVAAIPLWPTYPVFLLLFWMLGLVWYMATRNP